MADSYGDQSLRESLICIQIEENAGSGYVTLSPSPSMRERDLENSQGSAILGRGGRGTTILLAVCCVASVLYLSASVVPELRPLIPIRIPTLNSLSLGDENTDNVAVQQPHRTSFHFQPATNWMNGVASDPDGSTIASEQRHNIAVPEDASDALLRTWVDSPQNPTLRHPHGIGFDNPRDPTIAWKEEDGSWRVTAAARLGSIGISSQPKYNDFKILHRVPEEVVDFFPIVPLGQRGLGFSAHGPAVKHILKLSLDDNKYDHYLLGTYNPLTKAFTPDSGLGHRYDFGEFYACRTQFDAVKQRRILWGWVNESDSNSQDFAKGWSSVQAIPRTLWLDTKTGSNLLQFPVEEVNALRSSKVGKGALKLEAGAVVKVDGATGGQLDVEVIFEYPNVSSAEMGNIGSFSSEQFECSQGGAAHRGVFGPFGLLLLTDDVRQEQTAVFFYISRSKDGRWSTTFCSDQSRSSLLPDMKPTIYGSSVRILPTEDFLSIRVLVDRSIVESFVQGGRMAITSRVYPQVAIDNRAHLFLFNNATTPVTVRNIDAWQMNKVTIHTI